MKQWKERAMHIVFLVAACMSIMAVILICVFLFGKWNSSYSENRVAGIPFRGNMAAVQQSLRNSSDDSWKYLCNGRSDCDRCSDWNSDSNFYGVLLSKENLSRVKGSDRTAGRNSISCVWIFGSVVLVPVIREFLPPGYDGNSMLTASILLGIMILPTIIGVTESALRAVPISYYEGTLALGATHERKSIFKVVLPAAKSGVTAGVILGIGRAIGETMAVILVAGNQPRMPKGLIEGVRTLTSANIVIEMGYATDLQIQC